MGEIEIHNTISYIEKNIHLDATCGNNKSYHEDLKYMQAADGFCDYFQRNYQVSNPEDKFLQILANLYSKEDELADALNMYSELKCYDNKKINKLTLRKINIRLKEFYKLLGETLNDSGILDSLVKRHNFSCSQNININYLKTDKKYVLNEFEQGGIDNNLPVMFSKISFWLNKITKYQTYVEYSTNYRKDIDNFTQTKEETNLYVSKLKTDFIESIYTDLLCTSLNFDDTVDSYVEQYQEKYKELFGTYFKKLDLKRDLNTIRLSHNIREGLYSMKNNTATSALGFLIIEQQKGKTNSNIYRWGVVEDYTRNYINNKYILGIDLCGYPEPLTLHLSKAYIDRLISDVQCNMIPTQDKSIPVPSYSTLKIPTDKFPDVFRTNILCPATQKQKDLLLRDATNNPANALIDHLNKQVNLGKSIKSPTTKFIYIR